MIRLEHISKAYGTRVLLRDVSYRFKPGDVTAVVAPNGVGKTTLLSIISGLLQADQGQVVYQEKQSRDTCSIVMAGEKNLYMKNTVLENLIYFGILRGMRKKEVLHRIEELEHCVPFLPAVRNQLAERLSYGQKRMVSIFAALVTDASSILLDEATEGLDMEYVHSLRQIIRTCSADRVMILASHDYDFTAQVSDKILFLKDGRLTEVSDGTGGLGSEGHSSMEELKEIYRRFYHIEEEGRGE